MKRLLFVILAFSVFCYFGCGKTVPDNPACSSAMPYQDSNALLKYAKENSIIPTLDNTGLYYQIIDAGTYPKPTSTSILTVNYVGRLMSNALFDSASNTNLNHIPLDSLIIGWRIGLPKIGKGGHIKLLIPSAYAWGCTGYGPVPANAPVFFDIELLDVQ